MSKRAAAILAVLAVAAVVWTVIFSAKPVPSSPPASRAPKPSSARPVSGQFKPASSEPASNSKNPAREVVMREISGQGAGKSSVAGGAASGGVKGAASQSEGARRLHDVRRMTSVEKNGVLLAPRVSPDGLQILATRPGGGGLFLIDRRTGESAQLAQSGAEARWTSEGQIRMRDENGVEHLLNSDGLEDEPGASPQAAASDPVFAQDDAIYARSGSGGAPQPLTNGTDKFFNPVLSPDGQYVVYQGLNTGLYLCRADGSGDPRFLGAGNHPAWLPDSSGVVFDVTADDGHNLIRGDIYYSDVNAQERTNLTAGGDLVAQMPSVSPDGNTVFFESGGEIYSGNLR